MSQLFYLSHYFYHLCRPINVGSKRTTRPTHGEKYERDTAGGTDKYNYVMYSSISFLMRFLILWRLMANCQVKCAFNHSAPTDLFNFLSKLPKSRKLEKQKRFFLFNFIWLNLLLSRTDLVENCFLIVLYFHQILKYSNFSASYILKITVNVWRRLEVYFFN